MAEGTSSTELSHLQREIERSRRDVAEALVDLEAAARKLTTKEHWLSVAHRVYRDRPWVFIGAAAVLGYRLGRPRRD